MVPVQTPIGARAGRPRPRACRGAETLAALGAHTLAPTEVAAPDASTFFAHWQSRALGPLHLVSFEASPQRSIHRMSRSSAPSNA